MGEIKLGRYQYYKGELYHVIGIARPEKDLEELAIAICIESGTKRFIPKKMFFENINTEGGKVPYCQEPPVRDWWYEDATLRVVLEHLKNL